MPAYVIIEPAAGASSGAYAYIEPGIIEIITGFIGSYVPGYAAIAGGKPLFIGGQDSSLITINSFLHGRDVIETLQRNWTSGHGVSQGSIQLMVLSDMFLTAIMETFVRPSDLEIEN